MLENSWYKKENPFIGLTGMGGGVGSNLVGGGGDDKVYVDDVFSTFLYKGNSTTGRDIDNGIDLDGEGGLVWIKRRNGGDDHFLFDTMRGVETVLKSNENDDESSPSGTLTSFNSNGFTVGSNGDVNQNNAFFVAWSFRKAPGLFDVVTYTGNSVNGRQIPHSLGSTPGMVIVKRLNGSDNWTVQHRSLGGTKSLYLNLTRDEDISSSEWNDTAATSTVFTVGTSGKTNYLNDTYVAYVFAHDDQQFGEDEDESIIKCGSYTGDGSAEGPTIDLGWEPQWLLTKKSTGTDNWIMMDTMRGWDNSHADGHYTWLAADSDTNEGSWQAYEINSRGYQVHGSGAGNTNGETYIYMAIRRPHKKPAAGTEVFYSLARTGNDTDTPITGVGFSPDAHFSKLRPLNGSSYMNMWFDKLRGAGAYLRPTETAVEGTGSPNLLSFDQDGVTYGDSNHVNGLPGSSGGDYINWMFKRAPGFFDVVTYTGDGTYDGSYEVNHNLAVAPEMIITKNRGSSNYWVTYHTGLTSDTYQIHLDRDSGQTANGQSWSPTADTFDPQYAGNSNYSSNHSNETYIAYLFASLSGISKVGSYTGTGNDIDVDCGFTSGARFVMVKRTDASGDWYVWDTERGIIAGDDPYLFMNEYTAEVTNTDYIDPLTTGFTITSSAPDALNVSGGTYIYLAIA